MPSYMHNPIPILQKLQMLPGVQLNADSKNEWIKLKSGRMTDKQLFGMIDGAWDWFVGQQDSKFALLLCLSGPDAGVWFHFLPNDDYLPGCHEISSF
jgi:hypothetical protein